MNWPLFPIRTVIKNTQYGLSAPANDQGGIPIVGMKDIHDGHVSVDETVRVALSKEQVDTYRLKKGDILLNRTNSPALVGKTGIVEKDENAVFASYLIRIEFDDTAADSAFINHYMNSEAGQRQMKMLSTRAISQANINPSVFGRHFLVPLPPLALQRKAAAILCAWDLCIERIERLIEAKEKRGRDLCCKLLFGRVRPRNKTTTDWLETKWFSVPADWSVVKIGSIAMEVTRKNGNGDEIPVLSCTKYRGLVDSLEYFERQIFSQDTSPYKVVEYGEFAYATNHIEEGSIGYQDRYPKGLISPMYTVFRTDRRKINDRYLYKLLKTETFRHIFKINTSASVDRRGSLRWKQFSALLVPLPSVGEQTEIAEMIGLAEMEVTHLQNQLALLRIQKRGLMQQIFTGKWPVSMHELATTAETESNRGDI